MVYKKGKWKKEAPFRIKEISKYGNYKNIDSIMVPHKVSSEVLFQFDQNRVMEEGRRAKEINIRNVNLNPILDERLYKSLLETEKSYTIPVAFWEKGQ